MKTSKSKLCILLLAAFLTLAPIHTAHADFIDVSIGHLHHEAINYVQSQGFVSGYPDGTFRPDQDISRAEFTKIIVGAALNYSPDQDPSGFDIYALSGISFSDISSGEWYIPYLREAMSLNIINGYPDGTFKPSVKINFAEAAKIIVGAFKFETQSDPVWYKPFIEVLTNKNAIPEDITSPDQIITRGQMAEIIYRLHAKEDPPLSIEEQHWDWVFDKAFAQIDCPKPPERNLPDSYYKGPMIDTHIHMHSLPDGAPGFPEDYYTGENLGINHSISEWVCMMDYEGTSKALTFFPVWDPIRNESLEAVKRTMEEYPDRFIPFIMPPDDDGAFDGYPTVDSETLLEMLEVYPGLFEGYGEIGLYERNGGAPALPPDSERLTEIYPVIKQHNLVVYFHLGEGQKASWERALEANPDITFIWHGDQLIDCRSCDGTLDDVADILENHPNVYYGVDELYGDINLLREDVTKEEFIAHFANYDPLLEQDLATWKNFIENHSDQVLWGTDRGVGSSWSLDPDVALTLNNYSRAFIGKLSPSVQEKFAYKNAEKLFPPKSPLP